MTRWTVALATLPPSHLVPMATAAEAAGFDAVALPDSAFYPEQVSAPYPFTEDGRRFWAPETSFVDPLVGIAAMAAVTTRLTFLTNVVKLPIRHPLLVAKQVASLAALSDDRFALGVGLSWMPEEFAWTGTDKRTRGARTDEAIEIIRAVCAGGGPRWVEHHGRHYDFDRLMISPAPERPVPIYVGGHSTPSLRRAARLGDGWVSANVTTTRLAEALEELHALRVDAGRADEPFAVSAATVDAFDLDGYRRVAALGVTDIQVMPWYLYGGDPHDLDVQVASLERFADEVVARF